MAANAKAQQHRSYTSQPKLLPRPTAASAARAAKNALNRVNPIKPFSAVTPLPGRTSPTRPPVQKNNSLPSQAQPKVPTTDGQIFKSDSKTSVQNIPIIDEELEVNADFVEIALTPDNKEVISLNGSKGSHDDDCPETNSDNAKVSSTSSYVIGQHQEDDPINAPDDIAIVITSELPISRPRTPLSVNQSRPTSAQSRPTSAQSRPTSAQSRQSSPYIKSRPTTPSTKSRSRPSTPRNSRPCNTNTSQSRPITPRPADKRNKSGIPTPVHRPSAHVQQTPQTPSVAPAPIPKPEQEDVMSVFLSKEKEFQRMKRDLDLKQQAVIEIYDHLRNLRERMTREGMTGAGEGNQNLELKVFDVASWSEEELARLCKDKITEGCIEGAIDVLQNSMPVDENRLSDLEEKASTLARRVTEFCIETFQSRQEFFVWVQKQLDENGYQSKEMLDQFDTYNSKGLSICESLKELKEWTYNVMQDISQIARQACQDRAVLWTAGDTLVREVYRLKDNREMMLDNGKDIEEIRQQLEEERASHEKDKEKLTTTETQLKQARVRISKMDRQIREAEANIVNLASTIKKVENESRQREVQFEAKARKLRDSLKTGEVTNNYISQQRNTLLQEIQELKDKITTMSEQNKETVNELQQQIKSLTQSLEEQKEVAIKEAQLKDEAENALTEHMAQIEQLQAKVFELECLKPNPETPTQREMELWAELEATKDAMHHVEDEISACKREKIRFLETLTKIAESENKIGMQQKLAAELLKKEESMNKMQIQIRELTKNIKVNEQKVVQYEQYIHSLQSHLRNIAAGTKTEASVDSTRLESEIIALRNKLLESESKIEDLSDQLIQKEQQLEQQGKTSRAQARVIKVREELINMLKNKETEQTRELAALQKDLEHRMKIVEEVNHQIATKAEEIQDLFTTLESKQQQIHRLEKIVIALEEQQRRAQAQRTRHEEKIAALEHELANGGSRRERKHEATSPMPPRSPRSFRLYRNSLIQRDQGETRGYTHGRGIPAMFVGCNGDYCMFVRYF